MWGDGAAALTVGDEEVIAQCQLLPQMQWTSWITGEKGRTSTTTGKTLIRDEGFMKIVLQAVSATSGICRPCCGRDRSLYPAN